MLCLLIHPMFTYFFRISSNNAQGFAFSLRETVTTKFTIVPFACFARATEYGVANHFLTACLRTLAEDGPLVQTWWLLRRHQGKYG